MEEKDPKPELAERKGFSGRSEIRSGPRAWPARAEERDTGSDTKEECASLRRWKEHGTIRYNAMPEEAEEARGV
jgi:hypothetical protein